MATNNASLYGTNRGEAAVFDLSPVTNAFNNLLQKKYAEQQRQRQQEVETLQAQQQRLNPTGLRNDADRDLFFNQVGDWREKSIAAMNERDPSKRAKAASEAQAAYMQAQDLVARSKQQAEMDKQMGGLLLDPTKRYKFAPEAVQQYQENLKRPITDANLIKNYSTLGLAPDSDYFNKQTKTFNEDLLKNAVQSVELGKKYKDAAGNLIQNQSAFQRITPEPLAERIAGMAKTDQKYLVALEAKHPELFKQAQSEKDLDSAINQAAMAEAQAGILSRPVGSPRIYNPQQTDAEKLALHRMMRQYDINNPTSGGSGGSLTPAQVLVTQMQTQVPGSVEKLISLAPASQYAGKKPVIKTDASTGEHVFEFPAQVAGKDYAAIKANTKLKQDYEKKPEKEKQPWYKSDIKIPFEKSETYKQLRPEIITKRPAQTYRLNPASPDYIAKAAEMAKEQNINLNELNKIEGQKGGRGQIEQAKTAPKQEQPKAKTVPVSKIKSLVGKPGYEGYTEKELMDYYKSQGYNVQ